MWLQAANQNLAGRGVHNHAYNSSQTHINYPYVFYNTYVEKLFDLNSLFIKIFLESKYLYVTSVIPALCSGNAGCKPHFGDRMFCVARDFPQSL